MVLRMPSARQDGVGCGGNGDEARDGRPMKRNKRLSSKKVGKRHGEMVFVNEYTLLFVC